ncbi:227 kDa spindle- and centromere-associated protein [Anastrepha ludens]|uniref:227 kDa spindle- and centromere-associated protein n=1 Tax=Anastrepha ludens TaxID=28586 RepID=UPI0023B045B7|nr:227 kDa spindle- and centromere-associated protein [Anastrepha ludens]XP_053954039.1 227 kDa spindle- and centromere-associated protein [Anastrepha ludens]
MVNELNKPPSQENLVLGERLLASQRQLQEMQEEHRQLLQEMEILRQRAAALSHLNEQQYGHVADHRSGGSVINTADENTTSISNQTVASEHVDLNEVEQENTNPATSIEAVEQTTTDLNTSANNIETTNPAATDNDEDGEDPETAEYLQKKLAEIAQLKARFKRVQNIMSTTDMIEDHITSKAIPNKSVTSALENSLHKLLIADSLSDVQSPQVTSTTNTDPNIKPSEVGVNKQVDETKNENTINDDEQTLNAYAPSSEAANEELLSAMMNMFSDFTADLRSQADDLRAERDRLRALKEDLLRRKRQS